MEWNYPQVMRPSIVTVKQNTKSIGEALAKLLLNQLNKVEDFEKEITVPVEVFEGESVKDIN